MGKHLNGIRTIAAAAAFLALGIAGSTARAAGSGHPAADRCDRTCLKAHADRFLAALLAHDPSTLPLAAHCKSIFNGEPAKPGEGELWKAIDAIAYHQYVMDPATGQVAFFGVAVEHHKRGTLFVRLAVEGGELTLIETIAGQRTLDGVPGLISPNPFFDYILPPAERRSRQQLIAIADSYFQGLQDHDGSKVPVSADCRRFEDGVQTSLNPAFLPIACNDFHPFTYMDATADRIYPVVDVERGLVLGQMVIKVSKAAGPPSAGPASATAATGGSGSGAGPAEQPYRPNPASGMVMPYNEYRRKPHDTIIHELFKVVDGKIMEIQTIRLDRPYGSGGGW